MTISASARRLGISDRQARRHADKLAESDRRMSDTSPTLVRLSALADAARRPLSSEPGGSHLDSPSDIMTDSPADTSDKTTDTASDTAGNDHSVLVRTLQTQNAELQSDKDELQRDKDRLMAMLDKALTTIGRQDQRIGQLEQLEAKLIQALPGAVSDVVPDASDAPGKEPQPAAPEKGPGLWARIWGAKG